MISFLEEIMVDPACGIKVDPTSDRDIEEYNLYLYTFEVEGVHYEVQIGYIEYGEEKVTYVEVNGNLYRLTALGSSKVIDYVFKDHRMSFLLSGCE